MTKKFDTDRLDEIGHTLGLSDDKQHELTAIVTRISETIDAHRNTMKSRLSRKDRNKLLRDMSKTLRKLETNLTLLGGRDGGILSKTYSTVLAHQLSNKGLEVCLGKRISWPEPSFRLLESRDAESRDGPYEVLENEHYRPLRENTARVHTSDVLQGLFRQLRDRLDALLALDRRYNRGGPKGRPYRNHAISSLADAFPSLFGNSPTGTAGGDFYTLCEVVLPELEENTDGLEAAIQRILSR